MIQRTNGIELPQNIHDQQITTPSMGEVYEAHDTLQRLDSVDNWAFGDKLRYKDARYAAKTVLKIAGSERVVQVVSDTHEWLAGK